MKSVKIPSAAQRCAKALDAVTAVDGYVHPDRFRDPVSAICQRVREQAQSILALRYSLDGPGGEGTTAPSDSSAFHLVSTPPPAGASFTRDGTCCEDYGVLGGQGKRAEQIEFSERAVTVCFGVMAVAFVVALVWWALSEGGAL